MKLLRSPLQNNDHLSIYADEGDESFLISESELLSKLARQAAADLAEIPLHRRYGPFTDEHCIGGIVFRAVT